MNSSSRRNISRLEVLYGATNWLDHGAHGAAADAVARKARRQSARRQTVVLEVHCGGHAKRSRGLGVWRIATLGNSLVPRGRRHTIDYFGSCFGAVFVIRVKREELALLRAQQYGVREIARQMARSPSTISRELRRNAATRGGVLHYRGTVAQWKAEQAAKRPKLGSNWRRTNACDSSVQDRLGGVVKDAKGRPIPGPDVAWKGRRHGRRADRRWGACWSPEQISRRLRVDFPEDASMRISHEAIYQTLYVQGRGGLRAKS